MFMKSESFLIGFQAFYFITDYFNSFCDSFRYSFFGFYISTFSQHYYISLFLKRASYGFRIIGSGCIILITEFDDDTWSTFGYTIVGALSLFNNSSKRALFSSFVRFGSSTKYYPDEESSYIGVLSDNYIGLF